MTEDDLDSNRRHFLAVATAVTGAVGVGAALVPFLSSLKPSARAQALGAPVQVSLAAMQPGEMVRVIWRGRLVFVLRRNETMLATLGAVAGELRDPNSEVVEQQPDYAANETRSVKPEYLVVEGSCTHLGCAPLEDFEPRAVEGWPGGFFCPCHGSKFDFAGRVFKGVPAPTNLRVPPHRFVRDDMILIGQDTGAA
ncbi:MAG: ubiquinol-cytochrome c reductase iron-sulfur subunit [Gammaproteobacteria bacterium]|nr:ubiquinol-cytochrome c reductase iron-sulfur subunit [Gammaproteobacteria bacterium]NNF49638.1 ubiquinol-cytochrome c reductase iron-sulfur subunit [Woeseiaceae bacterium]MBT8095134.1 ubiquinol-cytochrome c reductase iron-sulfur subunit [Gammaproteobacteria bacterium]MBT8104592.1 ubiquinol-cytochrome c reductase iron-sulfur subunit [Gammaproteobacteria bacterium]NNK24606.1 ubiquinol-cytochrome c reductase iron-sulfur subunit [Woeseiaceae bacterium]